MASTSSNAAVLSSLGPQVSEKLTRDNYILWKAQVLPPIRGAQLEGILDGTTQAPPKTIEIIKDDKTKEIVPNKLYATWVAQDQQLLGHLFNSLSKDVLGQVATLTKSAEVWAALETMFSAQSRARVTNLWMQLTNLKKGSMTTAVYFSKMKALGDELAAAGKPVPDDEMVSFILSGLGIEYNPIVSSVLNRTDEISLSDLYAQVTAYETRLEMFQDQHSNSGNQYQSSVNSASKGRGGGFNNRCRGQGRGRGRGGRGSGGQGSPNGTRIGGQNNNGGSNTKLRCQICDRANHTALECWYRFEEDYQPSTKMAGTASTGYGVDTNWYVDSGATDHVTSELDKMTVRDKYSGREQVHTASGLGMEICNTGHATLHTPTCDLLLNHILHVPGAHKSLVSVHRLATDNNAYLEFHPNFFLIKDRATKTILHRGRCEGGLYPLVTNPSEASQPKQVLGVSKPSTSRWHSRLGYPALPIVKSVLRNNKLPFVSDNDSSVCDSCLRAKSHQLPYYKSNNVSAAPLVLIHSDVWGPAPESIGRHTYYVSFIDDYSRYTWIYLLKRKSDVF